jgi:glycerate kinase
MPAPTGQCAFVVNIVLAPDSFKGSLSAPQACVALETGLRRVWPDAAVRARPMADGGEGTLDAILHASGSVARRERLAVPGAIGVTVDAAYGLVDAGQDTLAILEIAQIVGITDAVAMQVDAGVRTTNGIGMLIRALLDRGVRDFRVGLGGSSTNDGGAGLLAALGVALLDDRGKAVEPTPRGLQRLATVSIASLDPRIVEARFTILSDVDNPLCGANGAIAVFGPQKGVPRDLVATFDAALARYAALCERAFGRQVADRPGAGAAGGLGFALQLLGGTPASGAEVVADLVKLDAALADAHWVITGEGRSDSQTLRSKAPYIVARRAARFGVPVTLVSGAVEPLALHELSRHFCGCFGLASSPATLQDCLDHANEWLADRAEQAARVFACGFATPPR